MNEITLGYPVRPLRSLRAARAAFHAIRERFAAWSARRRARLELLLLSDGELQDIGISRAQALYEFEEPSRRD